MHQNAVLYGNGLNNMGLLSHGGFMLQSYKCNSCIAFANHMYTLRLVENLMQQ